MATRKNRHEREREKVIQDRLQVLLFRMLQDEDNKYCVDCDSKGPRWASWNLGIFVCIRCAGIHRNLGVHISKVKSVNLDSWTPVQVSSMQIMGNSRARAVYEAEVPEGFRRPQTDSHLDSFIRTKYEKKKYIAREWVPTKVPDLPDGWTALIEAEKQKKDIRSIVLPSHSSINDNNGHNNENLANNVSTKRERQSPKSEVKTETLKKTVESAFDLLSLNTATKLAAPQASPAAAATKPNNNSISNDLLCLGDNNSSEFDDFVGAPTTSTTTKTDQNGSAPNETSNSQLFEDMTFDNTNNAQQPQKQAMTKDSIMALFNQGPTTGSGGAFQQQPPLIQGGFIPHGGMQMPAGFGLGGPPQQQPAPVSNMAAFNNPFLAMTPLPQVAPSASDPNNAFGGLLTGSQNFLQ